MSAKGGNSARRRAATFAARLFIAALANAASSAEMAQSNPASRHEWSGVSRSGDHDEVAICHKDHSGLSLAAAESAEAGSARLSTIVEAGGDLLAVKIADLDCAYCIAAIEDALSARSEIAATYFDRGRSLMLIALAPGATIEEATIRKIVKRRGYDVAAVEAGSLPMATDGAHDEAAQD